MSNLKIKVSLDFLRKKIADKLVKGKLIITGVGNQLAKLPSLPFTVAQLQSSNDDLDKKNQAAAGGDHTAIEQRNASEKIWITEYKSVGNYVSYVANGDAAFISSCGFDATSGQSSSPVPVDALGNLQGVAIVKSPGAIDISNDGQTAARGYAYLVTPTTANVVQQGNTLVITTAAGDVIYLVPDTHHHAVVSGLPSGVAMSLYGAGFNHLGTGNLTQAKDVKAL